MQGLLGVSCLGRYTSLQWFEIPLEDNPPGLQSEFILVNKIRSSNARQTPRHQWHLMEAYWIFKREKNASFCTFFCQFFSKVCLREVPGTGTMLCQGWKTCLSRSPNFDIPFCRSRYRKSCSLMSCSPRIHRFLNTILSSKNCPWQKC